MRSGADRHTLRRIFDTYQAWISAALGWLAVLYISATMLINFDGDTRDVSGAVFVVVAILAGLAFAYAGILRDGDQDRADVTNAGERLCQAAMIFIGALLLKYGTMLIPTQAAAVAAFIGARPFPASDVDFLVLGLRIIQFVIFVSGHLVAQLGYTILGRTLVLRISRRSSGGFFPPAK